jgi:hypothetical protein
LTSSPETVQADLRVTQSYRGTPWRFVRAHVGVSGLQPGWSAHIGMLGATLRLDSGTTLTSAPAAAPSDVRIDGANEAQIPTYAVLRDLLGVTQLDVLGSLTRISPAPVLLIPDAEFRRASRGTGQYVGRFHVRLTQHDITAVVPLRPGAAARRGAYRLAVKDVTQAAERVDVIIHESDALSNFDRRPRATHTYYLRNPRRGEAVQGLSIDGGDVIRMFGFSVDSSGSSGFHVRAVPLQFPPVWTTRAAAFSIDASWMDGAELVVVRARPEAAVERTIEIARFPIEVRADESARSGQ